MKQWKRGTMGILLGLCVAALAACGNRGNETERMTENTQKTENTTGQTQRTEETTT